MLQALQQRPTRRAITDSENSLLLRILIQSIVTVGIVATDVAADTQMSLWAAPLSGFGAFWSWKHRQHSQIAVKFLLSAAMLVSLAYFFRNLLGSLNDTRLVLAELLVQIQAIHTFDMPKRKDLGYSLLIGLILVSVAATISQTMLFALMLLLFLALALPALLLDYRSRLGLTPVALNFKTFQGHAAQLPLQSLLKLMGTVLCLGLVLFIAMPRFPGYQLQSMPVSADLPTAKFDNQKIINPGYNNKTGRKRSGQKSGGTGGQEGDEFDENSYYGFNQKINQNLRGQLKPQLVMRVRSQAPGFWRVLGFDKYTGQGWEISRNDEAKNVQRSEWSHKFSLFMRPSNAVRTQVIQSYTAVAELPNVLPALTTPSDVYFPTQQIAIDREDSLRSPVGLTPNFTYTVASRVPERPVELLTKAGNNYSVELSRSLPDYLQIPPDLAHRLRPFTEKIIADYPKTQVSQHPLPLDNSYDIALYLAQYIKQNYQTPNDPAQLAIVPPGEDLVNWFLFRCEQAQKACVPGGYPDHFATAYTMMLRSIGIPARLAVGFQPGFFNAFTGLYEVKNTDAHALTEVYFPQYGWYPFDPLPNHSLWPASVEENHTFSVLQQAWNWVAGWLPSPVTAWIATIWGHIMGAIARIWGFLIGSWLGAILGMAMGISISFGAWITWKQWRSWQYQHWLRHQAPMEQIYQQLLQSLAADLPKHPSQTPGEYLSALRHQVNPAVTATAQPIVAAYVGWRYGRQTPSITHLRSLLTGIQKRSH